MYYISYDNKDYSMLGYGTLRFSTSNSVHLDYASTKRLVDFALGGGVNYFDCAYGYAGTEEFLGEALASYPREQFHVSTKIHSSHFETADDIERIIQTQLKRLNMGYIDNYLLHSVKLDCWPKFQKSGILQILDEYKNRGLIHNVGFSFHDTPEALKIIVSAHHWDFAMIQLNWLDWTFQRAKEQYEILNNAGIAIFVMEPLRGGALAKDYGVKLPLNITAANLAFRFVAQLPGVVSILSGMMTEEVVNENLDTFNNLSPLNKEEKDLIEKMRQAVIASGDIQCTACGYCVECPVNIDIPTTIAAYNQYKRSEQLESKTDSEKIFLFQIASVSSTRRPTLCTKCGLCKRVCPQHIDIPAVMNEIATMHARFVKREQPKKLASRFIKAVRMLLTHPSELLRMVKRYWT